MVFITTVKLQRAGDAQVREFRNREEGAAEEGTKGI